MQNKSKSLIDNHIWNKITIIAFPVMLFLFSMLHIGQGITVTDTGYNYGNFMNFSEMDSMWAFATYLASGLGAIFTHLPFGTTMLGLNFYTGLVKAAIALIAYWFCIRKCEWPRELVFIGEVIALGLCWCPTALLYNYLTYLLFTVGAAFLYMALVREQNRYFVFSGICLGMNVFVRFPNLAEMALIVCVWLCGIIKKKKPDKVAKETLFCMLGYLIGAGVILIFIVCKYGLNEYISGIQALLGMTIEAEGYTLYSMIVETIAAYVRSMKWLLGLVLLCLVGMMGERICPKRFIKTKTIIYTILIVILFRVYKALGMFNFKYYTYESMFQWAVVFLMLTLLAGLFVIFSKRTMYENKVMASLVIVIIVITPLGSNNQLYSAINNLFLAVPFVLYNIWLLCKSEKQNIALKTTLILFLLAFLAQSFLFGTGFVFRDGMGGEERDYKVEGNEVLAGMRTTRENANTLSQLTTYIRINALENEEVILFDNVPSLAFYMNLKPAMSSTWPDLPSFSYEKFASDMKNIREKYTIEDKPIIIVSNHEDEVPSDAPKDEQKERKWQLLSEYMEAYEYQETFSNETCVIFE